MDQALLLLHTIPGITSQEIVNRYLDDWGLSERRAKEVVSSARKRFVDAGDTENLPVNVEAQQVDTTVLPKNKKELVAFVNRELCSPEAVAEEIIELKQAFFQERGIAKVQLKQALDKIREEFQDFEGEVEELFVETVKPEDMRA